MANTNSMMSMRFTLKRKAVNILERGTICEPLFFFFIFKRGKCDKGPLVIQLEKNTKRRSTAKLLSERTHTATPDPVRFAHMDRGIGYAFSSLLRYSGRNRTHRREVTGRIPAINKIKRLPAYPRGCRFAIRAKIWVIS